jgi:spermidine synthase
VFWIGALVGAEIPLLLRLLRDHFSFEGLVSRVLAVDYLGALLAALAFPLLFVPRLGLVRTVLVFGLINVAVAGFTLWLLRRRFRRPQLALVCALTAAGLSAVLVEAEGWSRRLERELYGEPVVLAAQSPYQRIAITQHGPHTSLYLNGQLQFNSKDEYRYHEALVHPAVAALDSVGSVLILGGGDGMAARELLKYPDVERIVLVDLDAKVTELFRGEPRLTALNGDALDDPRVQVINADAWKWLDSYRGSFDLIVADFPDPGNYALNRLFTTTFYRLLAQHLRLEGRLVVQATSPLFARQAFWCIEKTLREAGLQTAPYHLYVPSFGEWGFILAGRQPWRAKRRIAASLRLLSDQDLPKLFDFPPDMAPVAALPNRLDRPVLVGYYERAWRESLQ